MTAVEYIKEKLLGNEYWYEDMTFDQIIEQAKEMEMQIIAQAFEDGDYNYFYNHQNGREFDNGIDYYNEKFKSK
jgi:hypothetical protein